ncbi:MAG TPA: hypothetical protein V6C81_07150 [Planktothrix sp.]
MKFIRALAQISHKNNRLSTRMRSHARTKAKFIRASAPISPEKNHLSTSIRAHARTKMEFIRALARIKTQRLFDGHSFPSTAPTKRLL